MENLEGKKEESHKKDTDKSGEPNSQQGSVTVNATKSKTNTTEKMAFLLQHIFKAKKNEDDNKNTNVKELGIKRPFKDTLDPKSDDNQQQVEDLKTEGEKKNLDIDKLFLLMKLMSAIRIGKDDKEPIEVYPDLFIGSIGAANNKESLLEKKITHIVCAASSVKAVFPNDFTYMIIDILDSPNANIKQHFEETNAFIENAFKEGGKVLVHCYAGKSRSSTLLIAYLIKHKQMTYENALKMLQEKRPIVQPNEGFASQLREYQNSF